MAIFGRAQQRPEEAARETLGLPGVGALPKDPPLDGQTAAMLLTAQQQEIIGEEDVRRAQELLRKYKSGKANLEARVVEDELWWELRHWEAVGRSRDKCGCSGMRAEPTSAWLFNAILNKHADAMDNYPEAAILPREPGDRQSAKTLQEIIPVVLEQNGFEQTYSDDWWEKLKHGTAVYGIFWNPALENGLGDIDIQKIDLLNLFWEPGITDIQRSRNLFIVELVDEALLRQQYPQLGSKPVSGAVDIKQYIYDDTVDTTDKAVVVDWYYKRRTVSGRTVLHYAKFCGDTLLYASENHPEYQQEGWYADGRYPVVFDSLFPEKGTPVGFGYVSICKDPQLYIDKLFGNILEYATKASKPRTFVSANAGINEEEYLDWNKPLIHVEGQLDSGKLQQLTMGAMPAIYANILQLKIEEMKDTAANRDVNSGGTGSGITAAAAISALQEAGNKASRDMIAASYRAHSRIVDMVIERMRQFYDVSRSFRITGEAPAALSANGGQEQFVDFSNAGIRNQPIGTDSGGEPLFRKPVFDIKIKAHKRNPFSRMEQNQRALELYSAGFFAPENAQAALGALNMMEFEGKDDVTAYVQQGQTLLRVVQQLTQEVQQLAAMMAAQTGVQAARQAQDAEQDREQGSGPAPEKSMDAKAADAQRANQTGYQQRLAERSVPDMETGSPKG
nr:MAG TPA: Portal protein, Peptidoglycan hydrolase gp4, portal, tailspike, adhesin, VIRAL.5A [Caudoviricetes sp.]